MLNFGYYATSEINCYKGYIEEEKAYITVGMFDSYESGDSNEHRSWRSNTIRDDLRKLCGLDSNGRVSGETSRTDRYVETVIVDNSHRSLWKS